MQQYKYLIYKITNTINDKIYIGSHKTKNINDGYMGSGNLIKRAIKKYGTENFIKEILFVYDNPTQMYKKEAEIVNEEFLLLENTYNIKLGGNGGFDHIHSSELYKGNNHYTKKEGYVPRVGILNPMFGKRGINNPCFGQKRPNVGMKGDKNPRYGKPGTMLGKKHTPENRAKISLREYKRGKEHYWFGKNMSGENSPTSKPVIIGQNTFVSFNECSSKTGLSYWTITRWVNQNIVPQRGLQKQIFNTLLKNHSI